MSVALGLPVGRGPRPRWPEPDLPHTPHMPWNTGVMAVGRDGVSPLRNTGALGAVLDNALREGLR